MVKGRFFVRKGASFTWDLVERSKVGAYILILSTFDGIKSLSTQTTAMGVCGGCCCFLGASLPTFMNVVFSWDNETNNL